MQSTGILPMCCNPERNALEIRIWNLPEPTGIVTSFHWKPAELTQRTWLLGSSQNIRTSEVPGSIRESVRQSPWQNAISRASLWSSSLRIGAEILINGITRRPSAFRQCCPQTGGQSHWQSGPHQSLSMGAKERRSARRFYLKLINLKQMNHPPVNHPECGERNWDNWQRLANSSDGTGELLGWFASKVRSLSLSNSLFLRRAARSHFGLAKLYTVVSG